MTDARTKASAATQIETPCIQICTLDETSEKCLGCGRTRSEIARWSSMTSAQRRAIMDELPKRLTRD